MTEPTNYHSNSLVELSQRITQLTRRRYWRRLEQLIRDHYTDLLTGLVSSSPQPEPVDRQAIARGLEICFERTSDADFRMSLVMDFGNVIVDALTPGAFVPQLPSSQSDSECRVCLLPLSDHDDGTGVGVMVHRDCGQPVAHVRCFETWTQGGGDARCWTCKPVI